MIFKVISNLSHSVTQGNAKGALDAFSNSDLNNFTVLRVKLVEDKHLSLHALLYLCHL